MIDCDLGGDGMNGGTKSGFGCGGAGFTGSYSAFS
jgi:hypothetical protein